MLIDGITVPDSAVSDSNSAVLDGDRKLRADQLPSLSITDTSVVATEAEMLAIVCETGDIAVRTDVNKTFILKGQNPSVLSDWVELQSGQTYTLPVATATVLGGVKAGSGVTIAADGTISAAGTYSLPTASIAALGGIKVGAGLAVAGDGTLSVTGGGGVVADNDITTAAAMYPLFSATVGSGASISAVKTASTKMTFNPSTGTLFATNVGTSSDLALKTNIAPIVNPFNILDRLIGIGYNWKDGGAKSYGLGAQDVERVLPELVQTAGDGSKSVLYTPIIAFLIEAVKSLKAELDSKVSKAI